jgi:two-component system, chemotaxis family, chemotaxis protein CheY
MCFEGRVDMTECLLVDIDLKDRRELSEILTGYGFDLTESESADSALRACRAKSPDIIIMADRIGMASSDFVKRARRAGRGKKPAVLLYTTSPDTQEIGRVILEGSAECLVTPFDRDLLEFKLKQMGALPAS